MALDTKQKRLSVLGMARPYMRASYAGDNSKSWRAAIGNIYSGVEVETIVVQVPSTVGMGVVLDDTKLHFIFTDDKLHFVFE